MKLSHLKQITNYLKKFKKISAIYRVSDTIIKIAFDKNDELFFEMQRSNSNIFKAPSFTRAKIYNAPFDVLLSKRFNRSNILDIQIINNDKVLRFKTVIQSVYKEEITYLQLEFTGKYTNIIILDENMVILEALRHIDLFSSFREIKVGQKLLDIPTAPFQAKEYPLDNIDNFLYSVYKTNQENKLNSLKIQKIGFLTKKLKKLEKIYNSLSNANSLNEEIKRYRYYGNLVLSNIHNIKAYQSILILNDYDGHEVRINLGKIYSNVSSIPNALFHKSKKSKQKLEYLYIEEESLSSKIQHLKYFINTIQDANDVSKIALLFPKQLKGKKSKENDSIETFYIEGYKIQLGKNEKGNIEVLKNAKARDIWIHLKDRPSAHVTITTDKQNVPIKVIENAARICVDFSVFSKDKYLVDYTPRREVTIQEGANVLYNKYKTIEIDTRDDEVF